MMEPHNYSADSSDEKSKGDDLTTCVSESSSETGRDFEVTQSAANAYSSPLDRMLVKMVNMTGSVYWFFLMWIILIIWIVVGIVYKAPDNWQIVMNDGEMIQTYIWDSFLMRQQLDDSAEFRKLYGRVKSRFVTHQRLLKQMNIASEKDHKPIKKCCVINYCPCDDKEKEHDRVESELNLNSEKWFDRFSTWCSKWLGSSAAVIIYWVGIIVWIGCGNIESPTGDDPPAAQYGKWTNTWQLYINTATAVVLLITSVLLQNVRARNNIFVRGLMNQLDTIDRQIESIERFNTKDTVDNALIPVPEVKRKGVQKVISGYADLIGAGLGLVLNTLVFAAWIGIGKPMGWSDEWWLIINTYTGLLSFIDGFVLREIYQSLDEPAEEMFIEMLNDSQALLNESGIEYELRRPVDDQSVSFKISSWINNLFSTTWSVIASFVLVIILIVIASILHWSELGQMICCTPTMIIEGFCLLILIQAHNWADYKRRFIVKQLAVSRDLIFNGMTTRT